MNHFTIQEIYNFLDDFAPFKTQEDFDNSGLLIGDFFNKINKVLVCLDITNEIVDFCKKEKIDLIISHHPVIFKSLNQIPTSSVVYNLIQNNINAIGYHTNFDKTIGGIDDILAASLSLVDTEHLDESGIGRIGKLKSSMDKTDFINHLKSSLGEYPMRGYFSGKQISTVASCCGCGDSAFYSALTSKADAIITGDMRHQYFIAAKNAEKTLIDAGHFKTEINGVNFLRNLLENHFKNIDFLLYESENFYIDF